MFFEMNLKVFIEDFPWTVNMLFGSQAHVMGFMSRLRIMNPEVWTMSLFADYVKFFAEVEGQGVTLTFVTHVASFTHLADCKYKIIVHRRQ